MPSMRPDEIPEAERPHSPGAWRFLVKQWDSGLFDVVRQADGSYAAVLEDGGETIPLADMAYNAEIGLFRRSQFPNERDAGDDDA